MHAEIIKDKFVRQFGEEPLMVRSPGRINLIGEHTDYNDGFVLPAAIDREIIFALSLRSDKVCHLYAADLNEDYEFQINSLQNAENNWANYILGVVDQYRKLGHGISGFNCVFGGNIPIGAGLASSAAVECGVAFALNELLNIEANKTELARISQKAENDFVGMPCGIMDQFANLFGIKNCVIKLDCRSLEHKYYPAKFDGIQIVLCDTQVKHSLVSSEYKIRRQQCQSSVDVLNKNIGAIESLRDVSLSMLKKFETRIQPVFYKRSEYIIRENKRVQDACDCLNQRDFYGLGSLLSESHAGLRDDYEVSCEYLDLLVDFATGDDAVLGARMMGGGFGGCTINLIKSDGLTGFIERARSMYQTRTGKNLETYIVNIEDGTCILN
jgi:galactokinase